MKPKFTFKIINGNLFEYDANDNLIHYKNSNGFENWHEYDAQGNQIHYKNSDGVEYWREYDTQGNMIHYKNSDGDEYWQEYDAQGKRITKEEFDKIHAPKLSCAGKVIEVDGKKYKLVEA